MYLFLIIVYMDTEIIWKDIRWYEWLYQVNNKWDVKSLNYNRKGIQKILAKRINNHKYSTVILYINSVWKSFKVSRLEAIAFIPNPENKRVVNHINGIKHDDRLENLEWNTDWENIKHAFRTWLNKTTENNHLKKNHPMKWKFWKDNFWSKRIAQYTLEWELVHEWDSLADVFREHWFSQSNICNCLKWNYKSSYWYIWKYISSWLST